MNHSPSTSIGCSMRASWHEAVRPFVQHIVLPGGGKDPAGIVVRAKPGLAGWAARRGGGLTVGAAASICRRTR